MKKFICLILKYLLIALILVNINLEIHSQSVIPEILNTGTLQEQMDYLEERTRIYENYRAIREDMFQKIKENSIDSLSKEKSSVNQLTNSNLSSKKRIDSLSIALDITKTGLSEAIATKNNISVLGMEFNKTSYNLTTWMIIAALLFFLGAGFLILKRNMAIMNHTKKDLEELKNEYEEYRQKTREAREKMSMDHFNELKRIKGN